MRELSRKLAEQLEGGVDAMLSRVIALRRTALVLILALGSSHGLAWLLGRWHWPF